MSVNVFEVLRDPADPERPVDLRRLRWRYELPAVVLCVAVNLGLIVAALATLTFGWEWVEARPMLAERKAELWVFLGLSLLAMPAAFVGARAFDHCPTARRLPRLGA